MNVPAIRKRIDLVEGLRTFSRLDEAEYKRVNLVETLQSTLVLVQANYSRQVEIIQNFQTELELECRPAELNQAFMNIMLNACQAIIDKQQQTNGPTGRDHTLGQLTISTFLWDQDAKTEIPQNGNSERISNVLGIRFQDTGCGMSSEVKDKMFDPFFTTREVGKGTGLGLAIVFGIIENHQGHITVESTVGKGTIINLFLPVN